MDEQRRRSGCMFLSLCASVLFFLGSFFLALFVFGSKSNIRVLQNISRGYAVVLTTIAYVLIALSTVPEFMLDRIKRPFAHSRYGKLHGIKRSFGMDLLKLNIAQSILFLIASILQAVAFFILFQFEDNKNVDEVDLFCKINLAASWFWLFSAALAIVTRGCCWFNCLRTAVQTLDQMGNALYIISTIMWMFAALNEYENFANAGLGPNLQDHVMVMWFFAGCAYTVADVMRFYERNPASAVDQRPLARDEDDADTELSPAQWTNTSGKKKEPTVKWGPDAEIFEEGSEQGKEMARGGPDIESGKKVRESTEQMDSEVNKLGQTVVDPLSRQRDSSSLLAVARQEANTKPSSKGHRDAQALEAPAPPVRYSPEIQAMARKKADAHRKELEALTSKRTGSSSIRPDFSGMSTMRQPHPFQPDFDNTVNAGTTQAASPKFIRVENTGAGSFMAGVKAHSGKTVNPILKTSKSKKQTAQTSPNMVRDFDSFDPSIAAEKIIPAGDVSTGADIAL